MPLLDSSRELSDRDSVIVAVDFSPASGRALKTAAAVVAGSDVVLRVVHVVDVMRAQNMFAVFFESPEKLHEKVSTDAREQVEKFIDETLGEDRPEDVEVKLRFGHPIDDLVDESTREGVLMVVMGTTGAGRLKSAVFGSTASRVLRRTAKPVLMVSESAQVGPIERILAPVDFSESSKTSLVTAANLARLSNGKVWAYNAMTSPPLTPYYPAAPPPSPKLLDALSEERSKKLQDVVDELEVGDVTQVLSVDHSESIEDAILAAADDKDVDLICIGSHGRKGVERFFLGSTAEKLLRISTRPVLVVKRPES